MAPKIFISYRRADSRKDAGRIYDRLVQAFGRDNIFKDVDNIPLGSDFRGVLREAVAQCDVQLVIIGKRWIDITDEDGNRRLDNTGDFVRIEVESALQRDGCRVVPVLVDHAPMPAADQLPDVLRELAFKNARPVRDDPDFHRDVSKIIDELTGIYGAPTTPPPVQQRTQAPQYDVMAAIAQYSSLLENEDYEGARQQLLEIRASEKVPGWFDLDQHEQDIWDALEARERDKQYNTLLKLERVSPAPTMWGALQNFWLDFPEYDPQNIAARVRPAPPKPLYPDLTQSKVLRILPQPFAWCHIPAGQVTLITEERWKDNYIPKGESRTFDVPAFAMAKYPITNAQFKRFVAAGGYDEQQWWTPDGWQTRQDEGWTRPRYLDNDRFNRDDQPVVGVSWYEAVAFCAWLSAESGEKIVLPTEQQWQRAAQGDDNRTYPWGEANPDGRANYGQDWNKGTTTPVTQFAGKEKGDSPFGVSDMSGNVWEWCRTAYETGSDDLSETDVLRVMRGGSFSNSASILRAAHRGGNWPGNIFPDDGGLRCARSYD